MDIMKHFKAIFVNSKEKFVYKKNTVLHNFLRIHPKIQKLHFSMMPNFHHKL